MSETTFDTLYESNSAPWVIGEPQPAVVELERAGWIRGSVLDPGTGAGEHTIYLTRLGYDVLGIDFSAPAVALARRNAEERGVSARFEVADALRLTAPPVFDTVLDSALFHVFSPEDQRRYARTLHGVTKPGGRVHVLALAITDGPVFGPAISDTAIRDAFGDGWELEDLSMTKYRGVATGEAARELGVAEGALVDRPAWLARARRV